MCANQVRRLKGVSRKYDRILATTPRINATYSSKIAFDNSNESRQSVNKGTSFRTVSLERGKTCVIFCERAKNDATRKMRLKYCVGYGHGPRCVEGQAITKKSHDADGNVIGPGFTSVEEKDRDLFQT